MISEGRNYVALYRVSTKHQEESNLGLLSQKSNVEAYVHSVGGRLIHHVIEIESGGSKERISYNTAINLHSLLRKRPVLLNAIALAKESGAILIVKEVTRLTRSSLVFNFLEATHVEFICSDYPGDNQMMLKIRVLFGEQELLEISRRTIAGLKKSNKPLGLKGPDNLLNINHNKRIALLKSKALLNSNNMKAAAYICSLRKEGLNFSQITKKLNEMGFATSRGFNFRVSQTIRIFTKFCN